MKIALAMIIKDDSEAPIFRRCLESFMPYVDGLYVAVTGTSGKHKKIHKIVKEFGGKSISTSPKTHPEIYAEVDGKTIFASFAAARNVSFDMIDKKYDWWMWADVDDVLNEGEELKPMAQKAYDLKMDAVQCTYWYAVRVDKDNNLEEVLIEHMRERLLKPDKYHWISRLHEVAVIKDDNYKPNITSWDFNPDQGRKMVWVHLTDEKRLNAVPERNSKILELQVEETEGKDPRPIYYLAKEHFDLGNHEKVIELLTKYLKMSGWDAERADALAYLGKTLARMENYKDAVEVFHQATFEYPKHILPYLMMADCYALMGHTEFSDHWLAVAEKLPAPKAGQTIGNTMEVKLFHGILKYNKASRDGKVEDALKWAKYVEDLKGTDDGSMVKQAQWSVDINIAARGIFNLLKWLNDEGHSESIEPIIKALPKEMREQEFMAHISSTVMDPIIWPDNSIVYFASFGQPHFEKWSPKSLEKGIGGSETAVIRLSEEWAKKGKQVTVFCDCGEDAGIYNDVEYKDFRLINWRDAFKTIIYWRSPHMLDRDVSAENIYMDLHDVPSPLDWTPERIMAVDKVFFKSNFHREFLPDIPDEKCIVISNGIDE